MALLIIENQRIDIPDGSLIAASCQATGIPFNCHTGLCGSCLITVLEGETNLNSLTKEELDFGLDAKRRLACQCRILKGTVSISYGNND
jgi:ferredoxin